MSNFKKINGNFVTTSRQIAQDDRLTWKARGIFLYLASMSEGWNFYVEEVAKHSPQGKRALQSGLKELEEYGYLKRVRKHKENGDLSTFNWELSFNPVSLQQQNRSEAEMLRKPNEPLINNNNNKYQETINNNNNNKMSSCEAPYKEIIDYLNEQTGKKFRYKSKATQRLIHARLQEGYTKDDFKKVIDNKVADWKGSKWEKYWQPETLFSAKHFESYLNESVKTSKPQEPERKWLF